MENPLIEVSVIDDDDDFRNSLDILISGTRDLACISDYRDCETAIKKLVEDPPDVILMDVELPGISGIEGVWRIKQELPEVAIIMLTIHEDNESVFESLRNGASGYLVKNVEPAELLQAIKEVHEGGSPMSMPIARMVTRSFHKNPPLAPLSPREQEVLKKLCEGKSYQAIANDLFISKTTVKFHIKNIYHKLHVSNKAEAVGKAKDDHIV